MMSTSPDPDIHDVFQQLYDTGDWDDDETTDTPFNPDLEIIETSLVDTRGPFKPYDSKRVLALLATLGDTAESGPSKRRLYTTRASLSATGIPPSSPIPDLPSPSTYAPFSPLPLLARLRTYHASTFSPLHPPVLSPITLALNGWTNEGRERLSCCVCRSSWSVSGLNDIADLTTRQEVAKRLAESAKERHGRTCPWRVTSSPPELVEQLRLLLHPLSRLHLATTAAVLERQCLRDDVGVDYIGPVPIQDTSGSLIFVGSSHPPSSFAVALALFGWSPFHPNIPESSRCLVPDPTTTTDIVHCRMCERRIGLWSFHPSANISSSKVLDILSEHRAWCPIRYEGGEKRPAWWANLALLEKPRSNLSVKREWIKVSDKLAKKPWRRS